MFDWEEETCVEEEERKSEGKEEKIPDNKIIKRKATQSSGTSERKRKSGLSETRQQRRSGEARRGSPIKRECNNVRDKANLFNLLPEEDKAALRRPGTVEPRVSETGKEEKPRRG